MEYLKVMVVGEDDDIIWNALTEQVIEQYHPVSLLLGKELDIMKWSDDYWKLYLNWLYNDDDSIYNIKHPINMSIINSLLKVNDLLRDHKIFYWFDVDRNKNPDFVWQNCPLTNAPLISLPVSFHVNNRKISPKYPLIFPEVVF